MHKCIICNAKTDIKVNDNSGEYICSRCQNKFEKCEICGEWYLGEDLVENGICDNCKESEEG